MPALFLDRDGVINLRLPDDYVKTTDAFVPTEGMEEAIRILSERFNPVVVVTNQSGIGKGLMSIDDLDLIHEKLHALVAGAGGRIDSIYFCPHRKEDTCPCRKPATGMAWQALAEFPDIELTEAWLVGDSNADIEFGQKLGMRTVRITGKEGEPPTIRADFEFDSLKSFADYIR